MVTTCVIRSPLCLGVRLRLITVLMVLPVLSQADVLIGTNGERFVGKVVQETPDIVVFESELAGRLSFPRLRVREIQRSAPVIPDQQPLSTNPPPASPTFAPPNLRSTLNEQISTNLNWLPLNIGRDEADWLQLKSGEWLRGRLKYIQQKTVEFDSDELDELSLKLKNVRQIYPAEPMYAKFNDREPVFGTIVVSNNQVSVTGPEQVSLPVDELTGITRSGIRGIRDWSGKASIGFSLQSGNRQLTTMTTSAELARRTPNTQFLLDYLGNYSQVAGVENANNQRVNGIYDVRLDRHWFIRPAQLEYYHDSIANIQLRANAGVGAGYYIFDRDGLTWLVAAGPSYQYTRFDTVEPGQADTTTTLAGVVQSSFKLDITRRLDLSLGYLGTFTSQEAGEYTHHAVATLSFEIKRHLDIDISYVWDYIQNPQVQSSGIVPKNSDYYLTVGLGVRF